MTNIIKNASIAQKRAILDQAKGTFFSVTFTKKDGAVREMKGKQWEAKHLRGKRGENANTVAHREEYYTMSEKGVGYRNVNLNTLKKAVVRGKTYTFE